MHQAGMNAARINTAHGSIAEYKKIIASVRRAADIPIILDIKGPDLRVVCEKDISLKKGDEIKVGKKCKINLNFDIKDKVKKGDKILIHDGKYCFRIISKGKDSFTMKACENCIISPNKNANLPGKVLGLPMLSKKDLQSINMAKTEKVEYIALSFCRSVDDVENLRKKLKGSRIKIISKIENHEGIDNIEEIIKCSDGIMVARGDLGVEVAQEEVPILQKKIIKSCNQKGKLVIVATQMLESMVENSNPTRAETSDIANAVLDGADCLMLSEETAIGKYPVEAIRIMSKISLNAEPEVDIDIIEEEAENTSELISHSVHTLAKTLKINKIICPTYSGYTAAKIARFRMNIPIIAITSSDMIKRQLMLYYAIEPINYKSNFWDHPIIKIAKYLYKKKLIKKDEKILFTAGLHVKNGKKTNTIQIHDVEDIIDYF